jgi:hypothetical protein
MPRVGDLVQISVYINTGSGPAIDLHAYAVPPLFDEPHLSGGCGGLGPCTVTVEMTALQAGTARVGLAFYYEIITTICGPSSMIYEFVSDSAEAEVTVAPGETSTPRGT